MNAKVHSVFSHPYLNINDMVETLYRFTQVYKQAEHEHVALREAKCYRELWPATIFTFTDGDRFAGRIANAPIGFTPQHDGGFMGYYIHEAELDKMLENTELTSNNRNIINELRDFWHEHNTVDKCKRNFNQTMRSYLPSDNYAGESGIAFTLWRMAGIQLDFGKLMRLGIDGLRKEIRYKRNCFDVSSDSRALYDAMLISLDTFTEIALHYAEMATKSASEVETNESAEEFTIVASILRNISCNAPMTFREGLQLAYLYAMVSGVRNFGRMDDYLCDLYMNDHIDDRTAIDLLCSMWRLMKERRSDIYMETVGSDSFRYDTRIIIGGQGRTNTEAADKVASLIMEASAQTRDIMPQLALRFGDNQNRKLYNQAIDILASGYTFPMLYNDDVNIPSAQHSFGISYRQAEQVIQYGCGEYVLNHCSVGTPSGVINLLQALIVTMNQGIDPVSNSHQGMPMDCYDKYDGFPTFDSLFNAYKEQVERHVEQLALHEQLEYEYAAKDNSYLFASILMNDCIERGRAIFDGGIRYCGGTLETYGNANTSDSLVAIREFVYTSKRYSLSDLATMMRCDFKGFEDDRLELAAIPKYGNDDSTADQMMCMVHEHICNTTRDQNRKTSLHSYMVVVINNDANTLMGLHTSASADGRKALTHLNPGNNPMSGADVNGLTALLNSLAKPRTDIHAGAVQNLKLSKELFRSNKTMVECALSGYFKQSGAQLMLTVVDPEELEQAMIHPERYQNLIVRVGGFSERFVNLPTATQRDVLERTLY